MCVPDLSGVAPNYEIKENNYVAEIISEMGGEGYF